MGARIAHKRLEPFGVEVELDLAKGLADADKAELRRLFALDGMLFIRGLELSMSEQLAFCEIFGPVLRGPQDAFLISNVVKDGLFADAELLWHHDVPYVPMPFMANCLHALEVSGPVSGTRLASGFRAYEQLPKKLRDRIDGMNVLCARGRLDDRRTRLTDSLAGDNCAVQGVIQRQKGTGRPFLFPDGSLTACVIGLSEAESDALLEELFSYLYAPDNVYEHPWTAGDLVLWDNLALHHSRSRFHGGVRTLQRTTIARLSYEQQYPADTIWYGDMQEGDIGSQSLTVA
jgi:taurine dioxygenase